MTTKPKFDGGWSATVTDEPLDLVPRLLGTFLIVSPYTDRVEREKFLADTFGSQAIRTRPMPHTSLAAQFPLPY
ncbi:hypothetical protein ADK65_29980 [Streptomyces sp. NRRL B-1140]|uniref:hypothetical protein n=1 Tax=Streptomyces sp. NRRL B-1140 TaxID=1415549 RepID=UPI0006AFAA27|nr:hypothetical protein [Streptomyces sp. NRRL B-1140]KOV95118.1 hypothetical protein ADK65_29980 [Streptomyces sp. NRRL B-1140]